MNLRIEDGVSRGRRVSMTVDGERIDAHEGESVAAALLAVGIRTLRYSVRLNAPRGLFCHMGACQECVVTVNGTPRPACQTEVVDGLLIDTGYVDD